MTPAQAIAAAKPGDVLTFAADEPLGAVKLGTKQAAVTVRGGVADSLLVYGGGHRFLGLKVRQPALLSTTSAACMRVVAKDVVFEGLDAEGSRDAEGFANGYGLVLDGRCERISVTGSRVTGFWACMVLGENPDTLIDDCEMGRSRRSILLGCPGHRSRLSRLKLHTIEPKNYGGAGDHGNFIGFWTADRDIEDLVLDTITCEQRDGWPVMGVSMYCKGNRMGWWIRPTLRNIVVTSQHTQGITLSQSRGAQLERLFSFATRDPRGLPKPPKVQFAPMLFLRDCQGSARKDVLMGIDEQ